MFNAASKALSDILSPEFRTVLWKSVGLSLLLFVILFLAVQAAFWFLTLAPWPWVETLLAIGASLGLFVAFFFLMARVTALFAGLFLDHVAEKVEEKHYPLHPRGTPLPTMKAVLVGLQFGLLVLAVNILALPLVFTGIGAVILLIINAYLISREFFEMVAMRHMEVAAARNLRRNNGVQIFVSGLLPAILSIIPVANVFVPLFATSYFTHIFKQGQHS